MWTVDKTWLKKKNNRGAEDKKRSKKLGILAPGSLFYEKQRIGAWIQWPAVEIVGMVGHGCLGDLNAQKSRVDSLKTVVTPTDRKSSLV